VAGAPPALPGLIPQLPGLDGLLALGPQVPREPLGLKKLPGLVGAWLGKKLLNELAPAGALRKLGLVPAEPGPNTTLVLLGATSV